MQCYLHKSLPAIAVCKKCGKAMCIDCSALTEDTGLCPYCCSADVKERLRKEKTRKLMRFLLTLVLLSIVVAGTLVVRSYYVQSDLIYAAFGAALPIIAVAIVSAVKAKKRVTAQEKMLGQINVVLDKTIQPVATGRVNLNNPFQDAASLNYNFQPTNVWRCECGYVNYSEAKYCSNCGTLCPALEIRTIPSREIKSIPRYGLKINTIQNFDDFDDLADILPSAGPRHSLFHGDFDDTTHNEEETSEEAIKHSIEQKLAKTEKASQAAQSTPKAAEPPKTVVVNNVEPTSVAEPPKDEPTSVAEPPKSELQQVVKAEIQPPMPTGYTDLEITEKEAIEYELADDDKTEQQSSLKPDQEGVIPVGLIKVLPLDHLGDEDIIVETKEGKEAARRAVEQVERERQAEIQRERQAEEKRNAVAFEKQTVMPLVKMAVTTKKPKKAATKKPQRPYTVAPVTTVSRQAQKTVTNNVTGGVREAMRKDKEIKARAEQLERERQELISKIEKDRAEKARREKARLEKERLEKERLALERRIRQDLEEEMLKQRQQENERLRIEAEAEEIRKRERMMIEEQVRLEYEKRLEHERIQRAKMQQHLIELDKKALEDRLRREVIERDVLEHQNLGKSSKSFVASVAPEQIVSDSEVSKVQRAARIEALISDLKNREWNCKCGRTNPPECRFCPSCGSKKI